MNDVTKDLLEALKIVTSQLERVGDTRRHKDGEFIDLGRAAIARAEAALDSSDDTPPSTEERRLRRMLCRQRHGVSAYMDDGEATFGGDEFQRPTDYLRESLDSIEQAWIEAGRKLVAQAEPQPDADGAWKASVIDQLIIAHILTAEHANDPLKAVQDLLAFESEIAIDPRVSSAAARLVDQARAEERRLLMGENDRLRMLAATAEKWRGLATAKFGDGRTVQEIQREAAEEEREACAKVCDDLEREGFHYETYDGWEEVPAEACHCAAAIRARGQK